MFCALICLYLNICALNSHLYISLHKFTPSCTKLVLWHKSSFVHLCNLICAFVSFILWMKTCTVVLLMVIFWTFLYLFLESGENSYVNVLKYELLCFTNTKSVLIAQIILCTCQCLLVNGNPVTHINLFCTVFPWVGEKNPCVSQSQSSKR